MPTPPVIVKFYRHIDACKERYIDELRRIVKIPNVSSDPNAENHLSFLIKWMTRRLKNLGFQIVLEQPQHKTYKGHIPFVIVGSLGNDEKKKTLLYYCHLDVLKVIPSEWTTDPFELTEKDGRLYGRGTANMKGPLLCFIHAIECYFELGIELPINIKIICDSMYECKSKGLNYVLDELKQKFLPNIDCVLLTESHWLGKDHPCIVYGMRGVCYFNLIIEGFSTDLNSGDFGGIVREPMQDLIYIMNNLLDPSGRILVPNFYNDVVKVTPDEEEFYRKIQVSVDEYRKNVAVNKLGHDEHVKTVLMHVWRYPWFNMHYINSTCDNDNLLDIPKKIVARFSVRMVPNQTYNKVSKQMTDYIQDLIKKVKTPNKVFVSTNLPLNPWHEDNVHWNYQAANRATKMVYKEEASFIREGNGFPTILKLRDALPKKNILILPIVDCLANAHNPGENISIRCYIEGTKLLVVYFYKLAKIAKEKRKELSTRRQNVCRDRL